jgi:hypothetical protein
MNRSELIMLMTAIIYTEAHVPTAGAALIRALDIEKAVLALYDVPRSVPKEKP